MEEKTPREPLLNIDVHEELHRTFGLSAEGYDKEIADRICGYYESKAEAQERDRQLERMMQVTGIPIVTMGDAMADLHERIMEEVYSEMRRKQRTSWLSRLRKWFNKPKP